MIDTRSHRSELLDQGGHTTDELSDNLENIADATLRLGCLRTLDQTLGKPRRGSASLLDVGTGNGRVARTLARRWQRRGVASSLVGVDIHPEVGPIALASAGAEMSFVRGSALELPFADRSFDFAISVLTLHHFRDAAAATVLREMRRVARRRVVVADLERSVPGLIGAQLLASSLWRGNRLSRHDAPLSVRRAFTRAELASVARSAGLDRVRVFRSFPFRLVLQFDCSE